MADRRRVVITGTTGQVGRALVDAKSSDWEILALDRRDIDPLNWDDVKQRMTAFSPDLVIHCAAATDVDGCERDPVMAFRANALAARYVARAASIRDAPVVYLSTNFVFDGGKPGPYHEFDATFPISVYGMSKLAGEREVLAATTRYYVIRTAMVFAREGRNFVATMLRLMADRDRISVVNDQFGNPTYAPDLAGAIAELSDTAPFGTYHVTNSGSASWFDWATEIASIAGSSCRVDPIPAAAYARDAAPPANGVLDSLALPPLGIELPSWRDAVRRCLAA